MRSGDVIDLIKAHARGDEKKWLDTLEEMVKWEREKGNDVLADDMMRAMWDGRKDRRTETDGRVLSVLQMIYDCTCEEHGESASIEKLLGELWDERFRREDLERRDAPA